MSHLIVDTERATTDELLKLFAPGDVDRNLRPLNISSKVLRVPKDRLVLVGSDNKEKDYVNAFADAVHWYQQCMLADGNPFTFRFFAAASVQESLKEMMWTLKSALRPDVPMIIWEGNNPAKLSPPHFSSDCAKRAKQLLRQGSYKCPHLATSIQQQLSSPFFRWYRNVTAPRYSGRIDGLEVCFVEKDGKRGAVSIGKPGEKGAISKEREVFLSLSDRREFVDFDESNLDHAIDLLRRLVKRLTSQGQDGELRPRPWEHRLEARILNGSLPVCVGDKKLEPVTPKDGLPFQFPTQWSSSGSARYIDALMRDSNVPWVIEIKESAGNAGEYLRHGVVQAVLYRESVLS
jgi:hypothetical protein